MKTTTDDVETLLEVTVRFTAPITSALDLDPHQMATHMRETWINDDLAFATVLGEMVQNGDYDLEVKPVDTL